MNTVPGYQRCRSGSGSRRAKMTHKNREKKVSKFHAGFFLLRAEWLSCLTWTSIWSCIGNKYIATFDQTNINFFSCIFGHQNSGSGSATLPGKTHKRIIKTGKSAWICISLAPWNRIQIQIRIEVNKAGYVSESGSALNLQPWRKKNKNCYKLLCYLNPLPGTHRPLFADPGGLSSRHSAALWGRSSLLRCNNRTSLKG